MKKLVALLLAMLLLCGCVPRTAGPQPYTATYFDLFDTVTTVVGYGGSREEFDRQAQEVYTALKRYHQLFDIYHTYPEGNNLKTVNDMAGKAPVTVDRELPALLRDCKRYYDLTGGNVNAAMGSVLKLWHEARRAGTEDPENARLPEREALLEAAKHADWADVVIDEADCTVFLTDPRMSLDVGAIAKGWAVQRVAEQAPAGLLISVGGNVVATGPKNGDQPWVIGIQNPNGGDYLHAIRVQKGAVVTSGDYQRAYRVDGKPYHHIIDPATCMPGTDWRSVTVVCEDSGLADALSTALFLLPREEGQILAESCGAEALWVDTAGKEYMTPGFRDMLQ